MDARSQPDGGDGAIKVGRGVTPGHQGIIAHVAPGNFVRPTRSAADGTWVVRTPVAAIDVGHTDGGGDPARSCPGLRVLPCCRIFSPTVTALCDRGC